MASWSKQQESVPNERLSPSPMPPPPAQRDEPSLAAPTREETHTAPGQASDLLLGAGAEFEGKLTFKGTVRIDAKFVGSIVTNDVLVIGERARIDAEITCGTVVVEGELNGNVKAKTAVELRKTARVRGDLETVALSIEKGAVLQGKVNMAAGEKPRAASSPGPSALQ